MKIYAAAADILELVDILGSLDLADVLATWAIADSRVQVVSVVSVGNLVSAVQVALVENLDLVA